MNVCIDCGADYHYDSDNALGSSSVRCPSCRKKNSALNKKIILFNIASGNQIMCRCCGYKRSIHALKLMDTKETLIPVTTKEQQEAFAVSQYLVCLNCDAQIKNKELEVKIIDSRCHPVKVEFYSRDVAIIKTKLESPTIITDETEQAEIVSDSPRELRDVSRKAKRISGEPTTEM